MKAPLDPKDERSPKSRRLYIELQRKRLYLLLLSAFIAGALASFCTANGKATGFVGTTNEPTASGIKPCGPKIIGIGEMMHRLRVGAMCAGTPHLNCECIY